MTSIVVELLSRKIPIRTEDSEEHIRELVAYLQGKMDEIDPDRHLPEMTLAILALLNTADDFYKEQQRVRELKETIRAKSNFLLEKVGENRYLC